MPIFGCDVNCLHQTAYYLRGCDVLYKKRNQHEVDDTKKMGNDPMEELNADVDLGDQDEGEGPAGLQLELKKLQQ